MFLDVFRILLEIIGVFGIVWVLYHVLSIFKPLPAMQAVHWWKPLVVHLKHVQTHWNQKKILSNIMDLINFCVGPWMTLILANLGLVKYLQICAQAANWCKMQQTILFKLRVLLLTFFNRFQWQLALSVYSLPDDAWWLRNADAVCISLLCFVYIFSFFYFFANMLFWFVWDCFRTVVQSCCIDLQSVSIHFVAWN